MKRLAGNDTLLTGAHQAGPYVPKKIVFDLFPSLAKSENLNPRVTFPVTIASDSIPERDVTAIWYNNRIAAGGTRDECRITGWGGIESPLLDPEATGSLAVLSFKSRLGADVRGCEVWVCSSVDEEDLIEDRFGPVEPGTWVYLRNSEASLYPPEPRSQSSEVRDSTSQLITLEHDSAQLSFTLGRPVDKNCRLTIDQIPKHWLTEFPSGEAIIEETTKMRPAYSTLEPDKRLIKRRECEYEVFLSVEEVAVLPKAKGGFSSVDEFISVANSVTNRRKARSGRSLELQAKRILEEEGVQPFSHDEVSEGRKRPDFLFPSAEDYHNVDFPEDRLRMLAAKTTCKDRWRQVVDEAARIKTKHLLTLQEGVSEAQHAQMETAGIVLVVPGPLQSKYPETLREKLLSFHDFIGEVKSLK